MDEKTEELREIFMNLTDEATVTERQEDTRGSLVGGDRDAEPHLCEVVAEMREALSFSTDLDDESLVRVVRGFYEGDTDTAIADALDSSRGVVFRARMDLHLIRDRDTDAPFELSTLRDLLSDDRSTDEIADELDVSPSTVRRYARVLRAQAAAREVSDRYRSALEEAFTDAELSANMTSTVKQDGLDDALDGMETDVSF